MSEVWREAALCAQVDGELFFPTNGNEKHQIAAAKKICGACNVRSQCLRYALETNQSDGIWAGTTPGERRQLKRSAA